MSNTISSQEVLRTNLNWAKSCLGLFFVSLAFANTAFCTDFILTDGEVYRASSVVGDTDNVQVQISSRKSYCCDIWSPASESEGVRFGTISGSASGALVQISRAHAKPQVNAASADMQGAARKCFTWNVSSNDLNRITLPIHAGSGLNTATVNDVQMLCRETTLYGGYNTSVTDFNFIEISNTLDANGVDSGAVNIVIRANAVVANTSNVIFEEFTLNAGARRDYDVHSIVSQDFGPVVITHNGPPGAVRARTVQYRIVTASPLNFKPVSVQDFREGSVK